MIWSWTSVIYSLWRRAEKKAKKKLFIALGAIVLAVIVVVIYIVVRKKYDRKIRERGSDKDLHGGP